MSRLSEKTLLPISFCLVLGGGVAWLTQLYADVGMIKKKQEALESIQTDIAVIKNSQENLSERVNRLADYLKRKLQ